MASDSEVSSSGSEAENVEDLLRGVGMRRKYGKMFAKAKIDDLEDARLLTERRLKKIGITSSSDRKKILNAIAELDDDSSESYSSYSESESEDEISKILETKGLGKYKRKIGSKVSTLKSARKLSESKLKDMGISSSRTRAKIIQAFNSSKTKPPRSSRRPRMKKRASASSRSSTSLSSNGSRGRRRTKKPLGDEKKAIYKILKDAGFRALALKFSEHKITTLSKARALSPAKLKEMGVDTLSARSIILDAFKGKNANDPEVFEGLSSVDENEVEDDPIYKALQRVKLGDLFDKFEKRGVKNVRQAQELGDHELMDLGVDNSGQRQLIIKAMREADWKCIYCQAWNENTSSCVSCAKTHRHVKAEETMFGLQDKVKYVGRFRPTTRLKYGAKGTIHRVLPDEFYMVKFPQKEKTVTIRLPQKELVSTKK